ncbi:nucleobindin-2 isoform X2 [Folsomia candida]|uniref:nucleobindin-2 isoform X2 n=1 Tax=Folsomia candida TaxID=158441 RepID=UPI000B903A42|nr:nucleobindin-2 isoform X2 [Folsomia candida]
MKILVGFILCLYIYGCVAPPVNEKKKKKDKEHGETNEIDQQVFDVEYKRYLQEVVSVLESDDDFRQRLMKADPEDIKSGKISNDLEFVNHNVRSKLDELKRQELERLRQAAIRNYEQSNGIDTKHMKMPSHVDHDNPHTFEAEDLKKLIVQTTRELEDVDKQRKDEFKEYEMKKELQYEEQLKRMDEKNRAEAEKFHKQQQEKHREHKPLHHPGSKQQLEQVWEEQDHLSPEDFNPKTFFHLHDLDGNGVWDANEVKALFKKELDKMYDPNAPEDDVRERVEEMERMREHVFNETDTNRDQLISYQEFLDQTKRQEFQQDEGWDPIDPQSQNHPVYSEDEYKQYAKQHEEEIRRMMDQGLAQVPPGYEVHPQHGQPQGHHQQGQFQGHHQQPYQGHPQQMQGHHPQQVQGHHPQQMQGHPQQMQGHHPQQLQGGHHPQQMQGHPQQMQAGHHPQIQGQHDPQIQGHHPQQQQGYHAPPGVHPNAVPQQHYQGQGYHAPADQQHYQQQQLPPQQQQQHPPQYQGQQQQYQNAPQIQHQPQPPVQNVQHPPSSNDAVPHSQDTGVNNHAVEQQPPQGTATQQGQPQPPVVNSQGTH